MSISKKVRELYSNISNKTKSFEDNHHSTYELLRFGSRFIAYSIAVATAGAIAGEILDHLPYLSESIPKGLDIAANSMSRTGVTRDVYNMVYQNLDKVGSFVGLVSGVAASKLNGNKKKNNSETTSSV